MSARSGRRVAVAGLLAGVLASLLVPAGTTAAAAPRSGASADARAGAGGYERTREITRVHVDAGEERVVDSRRVTVRADRTRNLRGRERIEVSWSGARPSAARAANPYGEGGLAQEYPVVVLQCRGVDDPSLPAAQRLSPETCWTSTRMQRSQSVSDRTAVWRHDLFAGEADRAKKSGMDPYPDDKVCTDVPLLSTRITPFRAADGTTVYPSCSAETMAPEAAVGAAFPPAEVAAFTDAQGDGQVQFEVRSDVENASLGCSDTVACSVVVIPIMGISCQDDDRECRRAGSHEPGSSNFNAQGVDAAVSPGLWWAASNWRNRFSIPVTFGMAPNTCDVLDSRAPTGFYGSELLSQAALQWAPAYCLDKKRFKFQHNRMADEAGFTLMENGGGAAALVSSEHATRGNDPIGYAPTAVTGFAVGYVIDRPGNAGEYGRLRLNARLLAKLLTQSYLGSDLGRGHEGIGDNPLSVNLDPEFRALNPGLDEISREAAATVLSLSESSDVMGTLTEYIASDKQARDFVAGKPDPWGMVVNPSYEGVELPTRLWPLLDDYVPVTQQECLQQNPAPYFSQVAAPVTTLRKIAEAVLDAWPNVQTRCDRSLSTDPWKVGRVDRQGVGTRFVLGIVSLGDAARFGLRAAALETRKDTYVGPTDRSMGAAVALAEQETKLGAFSIDQADVRRSATAYPGTMVVYTAARLRGMAKADAAKVASFIRVATTEGQRPGSGNGELPAGYLPIRKGGATARLLASAEDVADAVERQRGRGTGGKQSPGAEGDGSVPVPGSGSGVTAPGGAPVAPAPGGKPSEPAAPLPPGTVPTAATPAVSSPVARALIPALIGLALLGSLVATASRLLLGRAPAGRRLG